jgi:hypothetical protein
MLNHLPFEKLADLAEGRLSSEERAHSQSHVSSCARCAGKLGELESVIGLMRTDRAEDAPPVLISDAINLFRSRAKSVEPSLIKRIAAALSFDSFQMSPAFGVRSGQSATRQLLYSAGDYDLDLRVTQSGEVWNVSGQILGIECAGAQIEFVSQSTSARADLNEQCEFALSALPSGSYQLRLRVKDLEVEIPQLELRA